VKPANNSLSLTRSCGKSRVFRERPSGSKRWLPLTLGVTAFAIALVAQALGPVATWNHTPSLATGLYVRSATAPTVGAIVAFPAPPAALDYAQRRGWGGAPVLFLKPLAAGPGDHVCVTDDHLEINRRNIAPVHMVSSDGTPLPRWNGCREMADGEWFAYAPRTPNSMDSRYYGPVMETDIVGVFRPVWTGS
jgi:conjugative transfer signal peptidase TraF